MDRADDEIDLQAILARAEREADALSPPLGKMSWAVLNAAIHCRDAAKPMIRLDPKRDGLEQEIYIFYEYLYLFIDLAIRDAIGAFPPDLLATTQAYITRLISEVAVGMYFEHWASELKDGIIDQFLENLNGRAKEFADLLRETENELEVLDVFVLTAREVTVLARQEDQWDYLKEPLLAIATTEWMNAGLPNHFADIYAAYTAEKGF